MFCSHEPCFDLGFVRRLVLHANAPQKYHMVIANSKGCFNKGLVVYKHRRESERARERAKGRKSNMQKGFIDVTHTKHSLGFCALNMNRGRRGEKKIVERGSFLFFSFCKKKRDAHTKVQGTKERKDKIL